MQKSLFYKTPSQTTFINITDDVLAIIRKTKTKEGLCHLFVKSTTSALVILEDEEGIKKDLLWALEKIAPEKRNYAHDTAWGDRNGFAHLRAELLGPGLTIPIKTNSLDLGTWQNIFLIDFDNKPRKREVVLTVLKLEA